MADFEDPATPSGSSSSGGGQRVRGVTVVKPIVYGNISKTFGKKRESDGHTHEWTVYVKPYGNEDMSNYVKKVQFKLHESYPNANRVVSKPPYEVRATVVQHFGLSLSLVNNNSFSGQRDRMGRIRGAD